MRALGRIGDRRALGAVLTAITDCDWRVRAQAARSVGALRVTDAIPLLERALSDPAWSVRANAGEALADLGPAGMTALHRASTTSSDRYARDRALAVLESR